MTLALVGVKRIGEENCFSHKYNVISCFREKKKRNQLFLHWYFNQFIFIHQVEQYDRKLVSEIDQSEDIWWIWRTHRMESQTSLTLLLEFFNGDTLAPISIICVDDGLWTSINLIKENGFTLKKVWSRRYPVQTITDADNADDTALLVYTPTQAESLLHSLEQAAGGIGFPVNADKTEYMGFN